MILLKLKNRFVTFYRHVLNSYYIFKLKNTGISFKGRCHIDKLPAVVLHSKAVIMIGDNVTLNSNNKLYHGNMFARVKLMADKENSRIIIGDNTRIHGSSIHAYKEINIGKNCLIAANCQIFDGNGHDICEGHPEDRLHEKGVPRPIFIEDNVWIGMNSIILPGVRIESGSVVAAGSVVVRDVPKNVIVGGNPAIIIKKLNQ